MAADEPARIVLDDVIASFDGHVGYYANAALTIGLWSSERDTFARFLPRAGRILDVGCGAGRTTFGLFEMGYTDLEGYDAHPQMIAHARALADSLGYPIPFAVGDARATPYPDSAFAGAVFSFNGLMQTPKRADRRAILAEIRRVLAPNGVFVFTTHDRDAEPRWQSFWREEQARWRVGKQDPRLHEFGDRVIHAHGDIVTFVHFPDRREVVEDLAHSGFALVEDFYRSDRFRESPAVIEFSGECRFWIARRVENA